MMNECISEYEVSPEIWMLICNIVEAAWHHDEEGIDEPMPFTSPFARKAALKITQAIEQEVRDRIEEAQAAQYGPWED